jgi:heme/copper-type cytochrome/quinol oxidase subunit 3
MVGMSATLTWAHRAGPRDARLARALEVTAGAGLLFLGLQAAGWRAVYAVGLGGSGRSFFALTAAHAALVAAGVAALTLFLRRPRGARELARRHLALGACCAYWHIVALLWLGLFGFIFFSSGRT